MVKEKLLRANNKRLCNRIFICIIINILLLLFLYNVPINNDTPSFCIYKKITGKPCFNCGMTRAFLSILHFKFEQAYSYNWKVIFVFPYTIILYVYTWCKYILGKNLTKYVNNSKI
ncbi:MAG: DUF2752 domain-containing protein [Clostridia bacterium]|nr:DUF2752 domain-containing protein [Clostridia bacterium]